LNKGLCKDVVLVTLICEEVSQPGVRNKLCELLTELGFVHEAVVRPFTWSDLRPARNVEVVVIGIPKDTLGAPARRTPPKKVHFPKNKFLKKFGPQKDVNKTSPNG
jgi:hypothetical protein